MEKKPLHVFVAAIVLSSACYWLSYFLFPDISSHVAIVLISMAIVSVMHQVLLIEEKEDEEKGDKYNFLQMHSDVIGMYAAFFFGVALSFTFWFLVSPDPIRNSLFAQQMVKVVLIKGIIPQGATNIIFLNNLGVLLSAFILSLLVGTGAVFILTWNGSVLATYLGSAISKGTLSFGFLAYAIPELVAFFIGGIAGGILSVGIIRKHFKGKKFERVFKDSMGLLLLAAVILLVSAYLEVYFLTRL